MTIVTRLRVTIQSQIDALVALVENHDAVAARLIHEREKAIAKARYNLTLLKREVDAANKEVKKLDTERETWLQRAKQSAEADREKALQCIKRAEQLKDRSQQQLTILTETDGMTRQLEAEIVQTEKGVEALKLKQKVLRTREARNEAARLAVVGGVDSNTDRVFQRWEERVETDGAATLFTDVKPEDTLEEGFRSVEEREQLESLLNDLVKQ